MRFFRSLATALILAIAPAPLLADAAAPSASETLLEIEHSSALRRFDRAALDALPQHATRTSTEWTDGAPRFGGPLVRDVLAAAEIEGETVLATAANDYAVEIPFSDFQRYDVILATSMNGARLTLRDKGPIWIVYPRDDHPELKDPAYNARWIWQLVRLEVR